MLPNERIRIVVRTDESGTTEVLKQALRSFDDSKWTFPADATPMWPKVLLLDLASFYYSGFVKLNILFETSTCRTLYEQDFSPLISL